MAILSRKNRESDNKINTIKEMVLSSEEALWEGDPMKALVFEGTERRKKLNWWARFLLSLIIHYLQLSYLQILSPNLSNLSFSKKKYYINTLHQHY